MFTFTSRPGLAALVERVAGLRRLRVRHARMLAAVLAGLAVWLVISPLVARAASGDTTVVTLRHDLPSGRVVAAGDVTTTQYPSKLVPPEAIREPAQVIGRRLSAPASTGEVMTTARLNPTRGLRNGEVAMTVPVDAVTASTLSAGDSCDLILQTPRGGGGTFTERSPVRILTLFSESRGGNIGLSGSATASALIAIRSQDANKLTLTGEGTTPRLLIKP